jgi:hypothetical protein
MTMGKEHGTARASCTDSRGALTALPQAVAEAPTDATLCVFHIVTLAHFLPEAQERFRLLILELARQRDLF